MVYILTFQAYGMREYGLLGAFNSMKTAYNDIHRWFENGEYIVTEADCAEDKIVYTNLGTYLINYFTVR